ncbi:hypothetical protein DV515_00014006, partial [Chloebia gouldiae]
ASALPCSCPACSGPRLGHGLGGFPECPRAPLGNPAPEPGSAQPACWGGETRAPPSPGLFLMLLSPQTVSPGAAGLGHGPRAVWDLHQSLLGVQRWLQTQRRAWMGCSCCHPPWPSEDEDGARQEEDRLPLLGAEWKASVLGDCLQSPTLGWESCSGCPVLGQTGHRRLWPSRVSSGREDGR